MARIMADGPHANGWASISEPLKMFKKEAWRCGIFFFVNLAVGLLGVYVAILIPIFSQSHTFYEQLTSSLRSGALYTFTIALLSSNAVFLLQGQSKKAVEHVRRWKISAVVVALVLVVFAAVPAGMQAWIDAAKQNSSTAANALQVALCLFGVAAASYCFLLAIYEEDLDDFATAEAAVRQELVEKSKASDSDGRGIQL